MYDIIELNGKLVSDLREIAKELEIAKYEGLKKQELIYKILDHQALNPSDELLKKEQKERKSKGKRKRVRHDGPEKVATTDATERAYSEPVSKSAEKIEKELFPADGSKKDKGGKGKDVPAPAGGLEGEVLSKPQDKQEHKPRHDNRDGGELDIGEKIQAKLGKGNRSHDNQDHGQHGGRYFSIYGKLWYFHWTASLILTSSPSSRP